MPFKSKRQRSACYARRDPRWDCEEWDRETDLAHLRPNSRKSDEEIYEEWRELVNMTPKELREFMASEYGQEAGLSKEEAEHLGIRRGWDSAKAILRMKAKPVSRWTDEDWQWARRQVAFIKRMRGNRGPFFDRDGEPTRKLTSLLIWGHNPL